jgi:hypothetical protein
MVFYASLPVAPQIVEPQAIFRSLELCQESQSQSRPLFGIYDTLENGLLYPLSIVEARLCDAPKASTAVRRRRRHVVAHQNHHLSAHLPRSLSLLPEEWWIGVHIAPQEPSEQLRLEMYE